VAGSTRRRRQKRKPYLATTKVLKVDEGLGLVFGWGMICTDADGQYLDADDEGVSTTEMLKAVTDFSAQAVSPTDDAHDEVPDGTVVFSFPLTKEIAEQFDIDCPVEGWMVAVRPSPEVLKKFADGTYTGFSVGGSVGAWDPYGEAA